MNGPVDLHIFGECICFMHVHAHARCALVLIGSFVQYGHLCNVQGDWEPAAPSGRRTGGVLGVFWRCLAVWGGGGGDYNQNLIGF